MQSRIRVNGTIAYVALILAFFAWAYAERMMAPVDYSDETGVSVTIPKGAGTSAIADILEAEGLIKSATAFKAYVKLTGKDGDLKFGKYEIAPSEGVRQIASKLAKGIQKGVKLTVPEGYTAKQIAARVEAAGIALYDEFMGFVEKPTDEMKALLPFPVSGSLEGYLFPDTYEFLEGMGAEAAIKAMLGNFAEKAGPELSSNLKVDLTPEQVVILASIVEKEALLTEELPIVAGVFLNRLKISMALQSCSTVQYVLPQQKPVLSKEDTLIDSPYNTYQIQGLPPGAISNPGLKAIQAVLRPADHDYLFFVANGDGSHSFSKTYGEHLKAKFSN